MTIKQREIIRSFKRLGEETEVSSLINEVKISNEAGVYLGHLRPVDLILSKDSAVIESLMRWRQRFMRYFLTQFEATPERTAQWLANVVIPDDSRVLFLILDESDRAVGNFGVCNITPVSAELDNLIRGEKGGDARLIYFSEIALIHWLYEELGVQEIYLHAFSNNGPTVALHKSIGFQQLDSFALKKLEADGEVRFVLADGNKSCVNENDKELEDVAPFSLLKMGLAKDDYYARFPWVKAQAKNG